MTVFRILKEHLLYTYHLQRVQALLPRDFPNGLESCNWMLEMIRRNRDFLKTIEFTDACSFLREKIFNFHNYHIWAAENLHAIFETNHQEHISLNVWVGVIGDYLIGPHFLPPRLNGGKSPLDPRISILSISLLGAIYSSRCRGLKKPHHRCLQGNNRDSRNI
nr:unnamed protein product [Callosobruchus chinensis]